MVEKRTYYIGSPNGVILCVDKRLNGETIGTVPILFSENVEKAVYRDYVLKVLAYFLL